MQRELISTSLPVSQVVRTLNDQYCQENVCSLLKCVPVVKTFPGCLIFPVSHCE